MIDIDDMDDVHLGNAQITETETMIIATPATPPVKRERKRNERALDTTLQDANDLGKQVADDEVIAQEKATAELLDAPLEDEVIATQPTVPEPHIEPVGQLQRQPRQPRQQRQPRTPVAESVERAVVDLIDSPVEQAFQADTSIFTAPRQQRQPRPAPQQTIAPQERLIGRDFVERTKQINNVPREVIEKRLDEIQAMFALREGTHGPTKDNLTVMLALTLWDAMGL